MCEAGIELYVSFATHKHAKHCIKMFNLLLAQNKGFTGFHSHKGGAHKLVVLRLNFIYPKNECMSELEHLFLN